MIDLERLKNQLSYQNGLRIRNVDVESIFLALDQIDLLKSKILDLQSIDIEEDNFRDQHVQTIKTHLNQDLLDIEVNKLYEKLLDIPNSLSHLELIDKSFVPKNDLMINKNEFSQKVLEKMADNIVEPSILIDQDIINKLGYRNDSKILKTQNHTLSPAIICSIVDKDHKRYGACGYVFYMDEIIQKKECGIVWKSHENIFFEMIKSFESILENENIPYFRTQKSNLDQDFSASRQLTYLDKNGLEFAKLVDTEQFLSRRFNTDYSISYISIKL